MQTRPVSVRPRSLGRCIRGRAADTTIAIHGIAPGRAQIDCRGGKFVNGPFRGDPVRAFEQQVESAGDDRCREGGAAHRRVAAGQAGGLDICTGCSEGDELAAASLDQDVGLLSGGNQQKVVIAKWLATKPRVIILDEPTKGIDIGSKAAVHEFMAELAAEGLAVIMVSSEIPEVLGMSDRVIVMREGRIVAEVSGDQMTPETLVRAAAGIEVAA